MALDRNALIIDRSLQGTEFTATYTAHLDNYIRTYARDIGVPKDSALLAVGGYGRCEMAPSSDLDIVFVYRPGAEVGPFVEQVWYPIWDEGLKLGQRSDTIDGVLAVGRSDLDTATALLNIRVLAGDPRIGHELALRASEQWQADPQRSVLQLAERAASLHRANGEVAFTLGPDLKLGKGGLRDVHTLGWVVSTGVLADARSLDGLDKPFEVLTRARVALHRVTGRPGDKLVLDYHDEVAAELGYDDADALMTDVSSAARSIAWVSDATWFWVERRLEKRRRASDSEVVDGDIRIDGLLLSLADDADISDPTLLFRVAAAAAHKRAFIDHETLNKLAAHRTEVPEPWTDEIRSLFVALLSYGRAAIRVIEALDQVGLMTHVMPEWEPCRSKPQRNAYHRFTVDRHLLEAASEASKLLDRVDRPDLLLVGTLLHDIGKGYPGDHTDVGVEMIADMAPRMGFDEADAETLIAMCRLHLLLPDVATRRDLDDDGTIRTVADAVGSTELLDLLDALTEADSIATGPSAWNSSKAELVHTLVKRTRDKLEGGSAVEVVRDRFPTLEQLELLHMGEFAVRVADTTITVVQPDRPGAFSRVAGVLTLNGLHIRAAAAHTEEGTFLTEFDVEEVGDLDVKRLESQLEAGASSRIALDARVDARRKTYAGRRRKSAERIVPTVTFDNETSDFATVIEVSGRDDIGLLYRVSRALTELGVLISSARIQTIGDRVVDAFYVTGSGGKVVDDPHLREIERAVLHAIKRK